MDLLKRLKLRSRRSVTVTDVSRYLCVQKANESMAWPTTFL